MSIFEELDPMPGHRTQFDFKDKRQNKTKINIPNTAYSNQHNNTKIPHGSRDHVIVPDNVKITFNLDIVYKRKTHSVTKNIDRVRLKKKVLMVGSKETYTINNTDSYHAYKNLYLNENKREENLLLSIQLARLKKKLIVSLELNYSEKVILFCGDAAATYNFSNISLKYDDIFDERHSTKISELYAGTTSIPYNKVISIDYQGPSKKDNTWRNDVNNLSVRLLQGLMLLFEEFYK